MMLSRAQMPVTTIAVDLEKSAVGCKAKHIPVTVVR
jgi:hypothetical protein